MPLRGSVLTRRSDFAIGLCPNVSLGLPPPSRSDLACPRQAKEPRAGPMCPGDPARDLGQRTVALTLVLKATLEHQHGMGLPAPVPDQARAGREARRRAERPGRTLNPSLLRQLAQGALGGLAE